jgi:hypothetical protein
MEILPDAARWRSEFDKIAELYRTEGVLAAMGKFGALVEEGGPKYSEEMQQAEPSLADQEMFARMGANSSSSSRTRSSRTAVTCRTSMCCNRRRRGSLVPQVRGRASSQRVGRPRRSPSAWTSR